MNKHTYINIIYNDGLAISHLFYSKQHLIIKQKGNKVNTISNVLNDTLDFIINNNILSPIYLVSKEVILSNIINEGKATNMKNWERITDKIKSHNIQIKAYTTD